ncbi:PREDICTED: MYB-like transcription factor TCL1 [Camelina sativa]|uniref:MYB-like transcription factor TCL1 n=1 Tax=Camelina sativa TaxID=90675 RepID=A0ABM1Q713_CAMSA|nr:PREDICTED: MYB-like transcription factor TCL1 [Camelina sativa]
MDNTNRIRRPHGEVSSMEWEFINMTEQEEDLIFRMYKLVRDRWDLIARRVVGREAKDIERYWIMRNSDYFSHKRGRLHKSFCISSPTFLLLNRTNLLRNYNSQQWLSK